MTVDELVPAPKQPFPLGAGCNDPLINWEALNNDHWWRPMTEEEVDAFLEGNPERLPEETQAEPAKVAEQIPP